jgi:hypothetical protein
LAEIRGGDKLQRALVEITAKLDKYATLHVGFLAGARYPNGTSVALIAAIQNYGAPRAGIPPRPFFSNMVKAKSPEWPAGLAGLLKKHNYDTNLALGEAGVLIAEQLRQSIKDTNTPPLKPATLRARGVAGNTKYDPSNPKTFGAKPLIRTGDMMRAVAYEVVE